MNNTDIKEICSTCSEVNLNLYLIIFSRNKGVKKNKNYTSNSKQMKR